ncbi:MAG TPA: hypothetical protein VK635_25930, partial [Bradyrhizobium sp.]|nr:hypothetical protein [Bradyrhizobium sp.]
MDRDSSSGLHTKLDDDLLNRVSFNWTTRIGRRASERDIWGYTQRCVGGAITDNHNDSQRRPAVSESTAAWRTTCCASQPARAVG